MKIRLLPTFLALTACAPAVSPDVDTSGADPLPEATGDRDYRIINGESPDQPEHDAVVMLLKKQGPHYTFWCSGTLIEEDVVLSAAHCKMKAGQARIFVGDDWNDADFFDHLYSVTEVSVRDDYNAGQLTNDLMLLRLSSPVTEISTFVPPLPADQGFTDDDAGMTVDHAGFGDDENGGFGVKLHFEGPLGGLGSYLGGNPYRDIQVWYDMDGGGPCFGDSGGPMFVTRSSTVYVGSVTSYGDIDCAAYGANTRVDAYEDWIADFVDGNGGGDPGDPGTCDLGQKGERCDVDADCCSNKCKGPSGRKSCK